MTRRHATLVLVPLAAVLAACTDNAAPQPGKGGSVIVTSSDDVCLVAPPTVESGPVSFTVRNDGSQVTEFYLYSGDGNKTVISEVENIGPGTSRTMSVDVTAGSYVATCKPGMTGDGIAVDFTVR